MYAGIGASCSENLNICLKQAGQKRFQLSLDRIVDPGLFLSSLIPGAFVLNCHLIVDLMHISACFHELFRPVSVRFQNCESCPNTVKIITEFIFLDN